MLFGHMSRGERSRIGIATHTREKDEFEEGFIRIVELFDLQDIQVFRAYTMQSKHGPIFIVAVGHLTY